MGGNQKTRMGLATIWIVLVVLWAAWEASNYTGLYRWLAEWQLAQWGQYEKMWTAVGPAFLLCLPAIAVFRRHELAHQAERAAGVDQTGKLRGLRRIMFGLGVTAALIGAGSYVLSQRLPDPSAPPVEVDLAALGEAPPPAGSAAVIHAVPDVDRALQVDEQFRSRAADIDQQTVYVPLVAETAVGNTDIPVRIFVERGQQSIAGSDEAPRTNVFLAGPMRGTLVENGLPADVVAAFEKQGVKVAAPPFLLTTKSAAGRENYYIIAAIAGMFALVLLLMAAAQSVSIARAERRGA